MSAAAAAHTLMSPEEYLVVERASAEKHDLVDGRVVAMAGASRRHDTIAGNTYRKLGNALESSPCQPFTSDLKVRIPATGGYRYPDVSLACDPVFQDAAEDVLLNPCVLFEVLSDSTQVFDRVEKFQEYRSIPSFVEYVLISQHRVMVEHYTRQPDGSWNMHFLPDGETLRLRCAPVSIPVSELYQRLMPPK